MTGIWCYNLLKKPHSFRKLSTSENGTSESSPRRRDGCNGTCFLYSALKCFCLCVSVWRHEISMCITVNGSWQYSQVGWGSFASKKLCVRWVCPIRSLHNTTSINRSWWRQVFHSPSAGFTRWSLLLLHVSQCCCHFVKRASFVTRRLSLRGTFALVTVLWAAREAHLSAFSLPGMPTWLGTQQNRIWASLLCIIIFRMSPISGSHSDLKSRAFNALSESV